eukprot:5525224-Amphidinium_carterae.2
MSFFVTPQLVRKLGDEVWTGLREQGFPVQSYLMSRFPRLPHALNVSACTRDATDVEDPRTYRGPKDFLDHVEGLPIAADDVETKRLMLFIKICKPEWRHSDEQQCCA